MTTTVERLKGRWKVTIDGSEFYMNRFGVVWQEGTDPLVANCFPGWTSMEFVGLDQSRAVQAAVEAAGYKSTWARGERVWAAIREKSPIPEVKGY